MDSSYPKVKDRGSFHGLTTAWRYSQGYQEVPSSDSIVPRPLKSQKVKQRSEFNPEPEPSIDQTPRLFFGSTDPRPTSSVYSQEVGGKIEDPRPHSSEQAKRKNSVPDSGFKGRTLNLELGDRPQYPSPHSSRLIQPQNRTAAGPSRQVPTRAAHSYSSSLRNQLEAEQQAERKNSVPDSGVDVRTPISAQSFQPRYPSPHSSRLIRPQHVPTTAGPSRRVPNRPGPRPHYRSYSALRNEINVEEQEPLIQLNSHWSDTTADLLPATQHSSPFKRFMNFVTSIDDKYDDYLARRENEKNFKAKVSQGKKEEDAENKKIEEGMKEYREMERAMNEEAERKMEETRREIDKAKKMQMKMAKVCRKKREKKKSAGKSCTPTWKSKLGGGLTGLFAGRRIRRERETRERERTFEERYWVTEENRRRREIEQGGVFPILGREIFDYDPSQNPFLDDVGGSMFEETAREAESDSDEWLSEEEQLPGLCPFDYYQYRNTIVV